MSSNSESDEQDLDLRRFLSLTQGDDRSCVIVASAILEDALRLRLQALLVAPARSDDLFDGPNAPLATFSSRIVLSHRLGLISSYMKRDLNLLRKIRNLAAHTHEAFSFEESNVADRVAALSENTRYSHVRTEGRLPFGESTREVFIGVSAWIHYHLYVSLNEVTKLKEPMPEFGYIDWSSLDPRMKRYLDGLSSGNA